MKVYTKQKLSDKQAIVEDLQERFVRSQIVVLTDYKGLNVEAVTDLRRKLLEAGVEYKVVKNTLLRRAAAETDVAPLAEHFKGPSAIALGFDDPVNPAKVLTEFAAKNDKLEIKAAVMGGKVLDPEGVKALSKLPSREVLLSQVLSAMNGVPTSLVRVLNNLAGGLVNVLTAIKDKKEKEAA